MWRRCRKTLSGIVLPRESYATVFFCHLQWSIMDISLRAVGIWAACLCTAALWGCGAGSTESALPVPTSYDAHIEKWRHGRKGCLTFTYDHGWGNLNAKERAVHTFMIEQKIGIEFDATTVDWQPKHREYARSTLLPGGIGLFGHGHRHYDTDSAGLDDLYVNFTTCEQELEQLGVDPVTYAYPGGYGLREGTRRTLASTRFLAGRMFRGLQSIATPLTMAGAAIQPEDWYGIHTLIMFNRKTDPSNHVVHGTAELIPWLDKAVDSAAWLVLTYHEIAPGNSATYAFEEFVGDVAEAKRRDLWIASFTEATLYTRQRVASEVKALLFSGRHGEADSIHLHLDDHLPDSRFGCALTVRLPRPASWDGQVLVVHAEGSAASDTVVATSGDVMISAIPDGKRRTIHPVR